jgi:anti-sigma factor RsiW
MIRACADWQGEIGAYILGALDERAAAAVSQHLTSCAGCRAEFRELVPVRSWLSRLALRTPRPQHHRDATRSVCGHPPRCSLACRHDCRSRPGQ